jgi:hypothetical protein
MPEELKVFNHEDERHTFRVKLSKILQKCGKFRYKCSIANIILGPMDKTLAVQLDIDTEILLAYNTRQNNHQDGTRE